MPVLRKKRDVMHAESKIYALYSNGLLETSEQRLIDHTIVRLPRRKTQMSRPLGLHKRH